MPTVLNGNGLDNQINRGSTPDRNYSTANRAAADVYGTETPQYVGEIVLDETLNILYRATGSGTSDWEPVQQKID